jgi:hypothetical protein
MIIKEQIKPIFAKIYIPIFLSFFFCLNGCVSDKKTDQKEENLVKKEKVIEIITQNMEFQVADEIPSGWNIFRYTNKSTQVHFFLIDKYPEGKTIEDAEKIVAPIFQDGMDLINQGKTEEGFAAFGKLPEWFGEVVFMGGSGLVSPGQTCETTLKLDPGYYILECYVKMANGQFHSNMGMVKELIVTEKISDISPPSANLKINISSTEGMVYSDYPAKGVNTFSVFYKDQIVHENFVGHDVNLVKLEDNANINALENWVNWVDPKGLITPSPEGIIFMGGVNDMPGGSTGYFTATLDPGNYALISEVPDASGKNLLKQFTISD